MTAGGEPRRARLVGVAVWVPTALLALWALVRLLGLERGFPFVAMLAFTPYVAVGSAIPVAISLLGRRWAAAAVGIGAAAVLVALVAPRALGGGGAEVEHGVALTVITANAKLGEAKPAAIAGLVDRYDAAVLSLQELTPRLAGGLERSLGNRLPHHVLSPAPGSGGSGLFSSRPLRDRSAGSLSAFPLPRAIVELPGAGPVELVDVHVRPPTGWSQTGDWSDDLHALPSAAAKPLRLLLGDFNSTLDNDALRELIDRGYVDAADAEGAGLTPTWPDHRRFPPLFAIDHVLVDRRVEVDQVSVEEIPGSDHRAVIARLMVPRRAG